MPKEPFIISNFKGMAPAFSGTTHPIFVKNARADAPDTVLLPEFEDTAIYEPNGVELGNPAIMQEKMYVDGIEKTLQVLANGSVKVDNTIVGSVATGDNTQINVIGRQASISTGSGNAKFLRVGYPGLDNNIGFSKNDIVFENDYLSAEYLNFGSIRDMIPLNDTNFLLLYHGANTLSMYVVSGAVYKSTKLCDGEIVAIAYSIGTYLDGATNKGYVKIVYFAYYDISNVLRIGAFNLDDCYSSGHTNVAADFVDTDFVHANRLEANEAIISLSTPELPTGYTLNSIAATANKMFLAFNLPSGNTAAAIDQENLLSEDAELLYSFPIADILGDYTFSCDSDTHPLYKSWLPWNPYVKRQLWFVGNDTSGGNVDGYGDYVYLPSELSFIGTSSDALNVGKIGRYFPQTDPANDKYLSLPGGCGVICDGLIPVGCVSVLSYANDVVAFLMKPFGADCSVPLAIGHADESTLSDTTLLDRGCGLLKLHKGGPQVSVISSIASTSVPVSLGYAYETNGAVLYCWNGNYIDDYVGYDFTSFSFTVDGTAHSHSAIIKRHFDSHDTNEGTRTDQTQARFCLVPDSTATITAEGMRSSLVVLAGSPAIRSVITMNSHTPELIIPTISGEATNIGFATPATVYALGIKEIEYWKDTATEIVSGGLSRFIPEAGDAIYGVVNTTLKAYMPVTVDLDDFTTVTIPAVADTLMDSALLTATVDEGGTDSFDANTTLRYKVAFVYDGTSLSPLSDTYTQVTNVNAFDVDIKVTLTEDQLSYISKRITSINIYCATVVGGDETELYRLVRSIPINVENFHAGTVAGTWEYDFTDTASRLASFNADAGYSETVRNVSISRGVQCSCQNYLFVGKIFIDNDTLIGINTDNVVVRSLPFQPSIFNYQEDYAVLGYTPTALIPFRSRVYAFGKDCYSVINADTMAIEHVSKSVGLAKPNHATVCDLGIFLFYEGNMYHVDMANVTTIGNELAAGTAESIALSFFDTDHIYVGYIQKRNAVVVVGVLNGTLQTYVLGLTNRKWVYYDSYTNVLANDLYPVAIYQDGDTVVVVCYDATIGYAANKLFASTDLRELEMSIYTDCGDPDQTKSIYKASAYNGNALLTSATTTVEVDGGSLFPLNGKKLMQIDLTSTLPVNAIRLLIRRFVVK